MSDASKGEHSGFLIRREAEWRAEFERDGEVLVYENFKQGAIYNDEKSVRPRSNGLPSKPAFAEVANHGLCKWQCGRWLPPSWG